MIVPAAAAVACRCGVSFIAVLQESLRSLPLAKHYMLPNAEPMASRRQILTLLGALGLPLSTMTDLLAASNDKSAAKPVRVRTITTGLELSPRGESQRIESALEFLAAAKRSFVNAGYEVQTLRIATNPWLAGASPRDRQQLLARVRELDKIVAERGVILGVGTCAHRGSRRRQPCRVGERADRHDALDPCSPS